MVLYFVLLRMFLYTLLYIVQRVVAALYTLLLYFLYFWQLYACVCKCFSNLVYT